MLNSRLGFPVHPHQCQKLGRSCQVAQQVKCGWQEQMHGTCGGGAEALGMVTPVIHSEVALRAFGGWHLAAKSEEMVLRCSKANDPVQQVVGVGAVECRGAARRSASPALAGRS
jgi:hypothetical protein